LDSVWRTLARRADVKVAALQENLAREQVASAAALAYVESLRTSRAVEAAQSDLALSQSLYDQARDQHGAGTSTGVDVARAETRMAEDNVRLIRARVEAHNAELRLKRVTGLPLGQAVALADPLQAAAFSPLPEEKAVGLAGEQRIELQLYQERIRADDLSLRAAKAQHVPSITGTADYGYSGNLPDNSAARTGSIGVGLELPIFFGGQIHGQVVEAEARKKKSEALYHDTFQQVEEDVRLALDTLTEETEEVKTTALAVNLAERELQMARDRYAAGAGDNIQVTSAQTSLAEAKDQDVDALARFNTARINLAMSLGQVQQFQF
jgi:outer membrane protein